MSADVFLVRSWKRKYESSTEFISCKSTETQTNQTYFLGSLRRFSFYLRSLSTWATGDQVLQISGSLTQSMSNIKLWISGFSFCVLNQIWLENMLLNQLNYIRSGEIMIVWHLIYWVSPHEIPIINKSICIQWCNSGDMWLRSLPLWSFIDLS